jgi:nitrite reductase (NADH) small subunit
MTSLAARTWTAVCPLDRVQPERGVAALIDEVQIAIFRTFDDRVYAVGNQDPHTGAFVLSRGIVGSRGEIPTVASPLHKEVFDLGTGRCLDDERMLVPSYPVRVREGVIEVVVE